MLKVMIAEDDLIIAEMAAEFLATCGYEVVGTARTVDAAVALGDAHRPDLAVIDLRLADGDLGTAIPGRLASLDRLGILYATANMAHLLQSGATGEACIRKPYRFPDLRRSLEIVTEMVTTGRASPPFPRGFQILRPLGAPRG